MMTGCNCMKAITYI